MSGSQARGNVDPESPAPGRHARWRLWWRWTLATAVGEFVGFAVPAAVGPLAVRGLGAVAGPLRAIVTLVAVVLAGMVEGACLSSAQWLVLRRHIPSLPGRQWVLATAVAAGAPTSWG